MTKGEANARTVKCRAEKGAALIPEGEAGWPVLIGWVPQGVCVD